MDYWIAPSQMRAATFLRHSRRVLRQSGSADLGEILVAGLDSAHFARPIDSNWCHAIGDYRRCDSAD
jgi:hypothetical protein